MGVFKEKDVDSDWTWKPVSVFGNSSQARGAQRNPKLVVAIAGLLGLNATSFYLGVWSTSSITMVSVTSMVPSARKMGCREALA